MSLPPSLCTPPLNITPKDAEQAVTDFSGKEFMGQRLIVEFAKPPRNVDPDREPRSVYRTALYHPFS